MSFESNLWQELSLNCGSVVWRSRVILPPGVNCGHCDSIVQQYGAHVVADSVERIPKKYLGDYFLFLKKKESDG